MNKIKILWIEFWYWLTWFWYSRGGRRLRGRRVIITKLLDVGENPTIRLGDINAKRFYLVDRNKIKENT